MPSPREPGPGAAQPTESAKDSGHYPVIGSRTRRLHCGIPTALGIDLKEVRVVGDEGSAIVDALNALRLRCTYVFTTRGIGRSMYRDRHRSARARHPARMGEDDRRQDERG